MLENCARSFSAKSGMRRILPYVAMLMVYLMTPSAGEFTENLVHLLIEGHTAHAIDDDAHEPNSPEHGCWGPFHVCSCHASVAFTVPALAVDVGCAVPREAATGWWYEETPAEGHTNSVVRPPIA